MLEYENDELKASLSFKDVGIQDFFTEEREDIKNFFLINQKTGKIDIDLFNYFELTDFSLKNKNDDAEYNLCDEIKNAVIIFKKEPDSEMDLSRCYGAINLIILNQPPTNIDGVLTLIHELGHINDKNLKEDYKKIKKELEIYAELKQDFENIKKMPKSISDEEFNICTELLDRNLIGVDAITLNSERTAWAYALRKLRPFIKNLGIEEKELNEFIHDLGLASYDRKNVSN